MIRKATPADAIPLTTRALQVIERAYPSVRPDAVTVRRYATGLISSSQHFLWVSEQGDEICGALAAATADNVWCERRNCEIIYWETDVRGDGIALLRAFREWVAGRPAIKSVRILNDWGGEKVSRMISRVGFPQAGTVHCYTR